MYLLQIEALERQRAFKCCKDHPENAKNKRKMWFQVRRMVIRKKEVRQVIANVKRQMSQGVCE
jgi:hypothetical protein